MHGSSQPSASQMNNTCVQPWTNGHGMEVRMVNELQGEGPRAPFRGRRGIRPPASGRLRRGWCCSKNQIEDNATGSGSSGVQSEFSLAGWLLSAHPEESVIAGLSSKPAGYSGRTSPPHKSALPRQAAPPGFPRPSAFCIPRVRRAGAGPWGGRAAGRGSRARGGFGKPISGSGQHGGVGIGGFFEQTTSVATVLSCQVVQHSPIGCAARSAAGFNYGRTIRTCSRGEVGTGRSPPTKLELAIQRVEKKGGSRIRMSWRSAAAFNVPKVALQDLSQDGYFKAIQNCASTLESAWASCKQCTLRG